MDCNHFEPTDYVILIVDDVPENISLLAKNLNAEGYRIMAADQPAQALKLLDEKKIDLVLMDIMMPEVDGYTLCEMIKNNEKTADIPIIFLTARTSLDDLLMGFRCGAADYISKPFNSEEISVRMKAHLKLKTYENQLKKVVAERNHLLHLLCHDLSNPFTILVSMLEVIEDFSDREQFRQLAEIFNKVAYNGLDIINLVRRMQALEEGKINLEPIELSDLIKDSLFHISHKIDRKKINVNVNIDKGVKVMGEPISFLNSVLNNILTNAIKFSDEASTISVSYEYDNNDDVNLVIKDSGVGMEEELRERLFDLRSNTTRIGTDGEEGTGFGMSLVKRFVNSYGGDIEVFSKPIGRYPDDHGTTVKLTLRSAKE